MASLAITRAATPGATPPVLVGRHPKVKLKAGDRELELPYGPRGTTLGGWAAPWSTLDRPGRKPLVVRDGDGVLTMGLSVFLGHADHQETVEAELAKLRRIAASGDRVIVGNLSPLERGPWRLDDVTVTGELRQEGTNHITRASVSLSFIEASDANPKLGPVSGGKKGGKGKKLPTTHVVKKGDTLRKLADRYYGEPGKWRVIAKANNIKDPDKLKVGAKLRIPKEPKGDDGKDGK